MILKTLLLVSAMCMAQAGQTDIQSKSPIATRDRDMAAVLQPFIDRHELAGAVVLVASKDKVLSLDAVGFADIAAHKQMQPDALFWIASMSKPITATAVMMLVDEGKIRLDDPVEKYLPEFKGQMLVVEQDDAHTLLKKPSHPITIREILSHTSGLAFSSRVEYKADVFKIDMYPLREAVISYAFTPLNLEPGTKWVYSNAGINTAGRIIEVVSGMPYEHFMAKRLFEPLGMKDTTFWPAESQMKRLAKSYEPNTAKTELHEIPISQLTYPLTDRNRGPSPAGGLFSTATDISNFCRMILNGGVYDGKRYVSEKSVQLMTSTQTLLDKDKGENGYGLGWYTSQKAADGNNVAIPALCGHGGAYYTNMQLDPQHKLITVYMVQHAGFVGNGIQGYETFRQAAIKKYADAQR
jgi:CubicO group peptidase (beta-lactamase class C family)